MHEDKAVVGDEAHGRVAGNHVETLLEGIFDGLKLLLLHASVH